MTASGVKINRDACLMGGREEMYKQTNIQGQSCSHALTLNKTQVGHQNHREFNKSIINL